MIDLVDISQEVASLDAAWRGGDPTDRELRTQIEGRLESLRSLWRRKAELFSTADLRAFAEATGVPVAETQAGKGSLPYDHPLALGAVGSTGTTAANKIAAEADVVIGIGTRYSDFTTASRTAFANPEVRFVNVNAAGFCAGT